MTSEKIIVSFNEAKEIILNSVNPLRSEDIPILEAPNRILYENIISETVIPPLDNSAMDGYAVIADDTRGANEDKPVELKIIGEIQAGGSATQKVTSSNTIRIMTGAPMPEGSNAVVQFEDTEENNNTVKIFREVKQHENYRLAGENIQKGDQVLEAGERLTSVDIGLLASLNYQNVKVYKTPTVAVISTGDEIVNVGEEIRHGQIRNSSAYVLYSEIKKYNATPFITGIAKDTFEDTREKFIEALKADIVLSTGGVSKGRYDFVKDVCRSLGINILFERVNIKPGTPMMFGKKENKLIFGLPGNPVATLSCYFQFVRPALLKMMNAKQIDKPVVNAILEEDINKEYGKVRLLKGRFEIKNKDLHVSTINKNSSILRSMRSANCLIIIPEDLEHVNAGDKVAIQLIDHDEI